MSCFKISKFAMVAATLAVVPNDNIVGNVSALSITHQFALASRNGDKRAVLATIPEEDMEDMKDTPAELPTAEAVLRSKFVRFLPPADAAEVAQVTDVKVYDRLMAFRDACDFIDELTRDFSYKQETQNFILERNGHLCTKKCAPIMTKVPEIGKTELEMKVDKLKRQIFQTKNRKVYEERLTNEDIKRMFDEMLEDSVTNTRETAAVLRRHGVIGLPRADAVEVATATDVKVYDNARDVCDFIDELAEKKRKELQKQFDAHKEKYYEKVEKTATQENIPGSGVQKGQSMQDAYDFFQLDDSKFATNMEIVPEIAEDLKVQVVHEFMAVRRKNKEISAGVNRELGQTGLLEDLKFTSDDIQRRFSREQVLSMIP